MTALLVFVGRNDTRIPPKMAELIRECHNVSGVQPKRVANVHYTETKKLWWWVIQTYLARRRMLSKRERIRTLTFALATERPVFWKMVLHQAVCLEDSNVSAPAIIDSLNLSVLNNALPRILDIIVHRKRSAVVLIA